MLGSNLQPPCEGIITNAPTRHYYVDVQNEEESDYNLNDQYIWIVPTFRAQIHEGNKQNISNFLSLYEIIPAKKRSRQQPLLDYTSSIIWTSRDYIARLDGLLARKEATATAAAAKNKNEDKEATKEQRKAAKEQQQKKLKEERAQERARKKQGKEKKILDKRALGTTRGRWERVEPPQAIPAEPQQVQECSQAPYAPRPAPLSNPWVYPPYANLHAHAFYPPAYIFYTEENARACPM